MDGRPMGTIRRQRVRSH